ncbi:hypothetical protein PROFUN_10374 [Planoprotostelium fungivorum]|uniref:Homeobox domain-containing protein n=1 Tax=Planoprotostelium fungivorum TaxID=1890364 RepID=A0A2P6NEE6_9EUKA|nr:hypothetical protein PROFUN_10374 [Planoprotostelium fungivorum]
MHSPNQKQHFELTCFDAEKLVEKWKTFKNRRVSEDDGRLQGLKTTSTQAATLEEMFKLDPKPRDQELEMVARKVGLPERRTWYQNKRMRRQKREEEAMSIARKTGEHITAEHLEAEIQAQRDHQPSEHDLITSSSSDEQDLSDYILLAAYNFLSLGGKKQMCLKSNFYIYSVSAQMFNYKMQNRCRRCYAPLRATTNRRSHYADKFPVCQPAGGNTIVLAHSPYTKLKFSVPNSRLLRKKRGHTHHAPPTEFTLTTTTSPRSQFTLQRRIPVRNGYKTTSEQTAELEEMFRIDPRPDERGIKMVALKVDMPEKRVRTWYQNKRASAKTVHLLCHRRAPLRFYCVTQAEKNFSIRRPETSQDKWPVNHPVFWCIFSAFCLDFYGYRDN